MTRFLSGFSPLVCLIALALFSSHAVRADDTPATQPSAANGSIAVTVVGSDGKPIAKARLQLYAKKKVVEGDSADATPKKAKALAKGSTDEDGKYTFSDLASGQYKVNASVKKLGLKGSESVSITDDAPNGTVTITLSAPADDNGGGATTAPSTPAPAAPPAQ